MTSFPLPGWCMSLSWGTLLGSVTERCEAGDAAGGGDICAFLPSPSSSRGKTPFSEW